MELSYIQSLHKIRKAEFENTFSHIKNINYAGHLIEIGSGTGYQLQLLSTLFPKVNGLEIANSNLTHSRIENIIEYDGMNLPFPDNSIDYVFSSNTLEHIPDLEGFEKQIHRVLNNTGFAIHIVPTATWRFWAMLSHYIALPKLVFNYFKKTKEMRAYTGTVNTTPKTKAQLIMNVFVAGRHGERGNRFTEILYMKVDWWKKHFEDNNWEIVQDFPSGVFYTGNHLLAKAMTSNTRKKLSTILGSACHTFVLKKK